MDASDKGLLSVAALFAASVLVTTGAFGYAMGVDSGVAQASNHRYGAAMNLFYLESKRLEGLTLLVAEADFGNEKAKAIIPAIAATCGEIGAPKYTMEMGEKAKTACAKKFAPQPKSE